MVRKYNIPSAHYSPLHPHKYNNTVHIIHNFVVIQIFLMKNNCRLLCFSDVHLKCYFLTNWYLQFWFLCSESLAPISTTHATSKMNIKLATLLPMVRNRSPDMTVAEWLELSPAHESPTFNQLWLHREISSSSSITTLLLGFLAMSYLSFPPPFQAIPRDFKSIFLQCSSLVANKSSLLKGISLYRRLKKRRRKESITGFVIIKDFL